MCPHKAKKKYGDIATLIFFVLRIVYCYGILTKYINFTFIYFENKAHLTLHLNILHFICDINSFRTFCICFVTIEDSLSNIRTGSVRQLAESVLCANLHLTT